MAAETIRYEQGDDGIVVLTLDDPKQSANTMNGDYFASMASTVDRLEREREEISGVLITSAKKTFFAGGDLHDLVAVRREDSAEFAQHIKDLKSHLRRLETLGVPVVAAINGSALGGGLEITLACHRRFVADDARLQLGFPEVTLGLMPGAGGVIRSVRMLGIVPALTELLLDGRRVDPARALELGLIDEVLPREELVGAAKAWIAANPDASQPWDRPGHQIPGGTPLDHSFIPVLQSLPANLGKQLRGAPLPAPHAILATAVEGAQVDFDNAIEVEGRYFVSLAVGQVAKNMIQANFFDLQEVNGRRIEGVEAEPEKVAKVAILGAGMMGAGIAYVAARAGIEVVLGDVSLEAAERGKGYSEKLVAKGIERGNIEEESGRELLARITPTADLADAAGADLMIEAVFEDPQVKAEGYAALEPHLAAGALLASNTSTLPIGGLAEGVSRPQDFIGLHFFSPVDKMPLLEIVRGERTAPETVARALTVARQLRKTPILVNDSRGFFTSRVIRTFYDEGVAMLAEGIPAATIEQASGQAGYPAPVLALCDELNLNLIRKIRDERRAAVEAAGEEWVPHPADAVFDRMVEEFDRGGRLAGAGFYEYAEGRRVGLWSGLADAFGASTEDLPPLAELEQRMLFIEALESVRCLQEGVIESAADANVGSLLGIGFPRWTGGVLQYIAGYPGGPEAFLARARELAAAHGERFEPPALLVEKAERGEPLGHDAGVLAGNA
jgi:3-hydroxyacyl-CoA dehydrogenase/enoyl-CoA hydratase/3-hydroxybutyryl-CoA epimerase